MMGNLKKPLAKLQFTQILALPKADDFMLHLNNRLKDKMDQYTFDELERYFVAILNRLNGVEVQKSEQYSRRSHYTASQNTGFVKPQPAFCTTMNKNIVIEVSKNLLNFASSRNHREFRGYKWPFKIYGCGLEPNKYIPDIYVGSRNIHLYCQAEVTYEVEIVVYYLLHFARLPIAHRQYFNGGSNFQVSTVKKTYEKLFNTFLNQFIPDALKNKRRKEGFRKSAPFIQVFGDLWFSPSFSESPISERIQLIPLMSALVRRVTITQAFYQWEWQLGGTQTTLRNDKLSSRTCLSYESQALQRPLFEFLFQAFTQWPLDTVQDIKAVVDMWLQFITPWKVEKQREASMTNEEFQTVWGQWVAENLHFYSTIFKEFLRLSVNLDFRPLWARKMLNKVLSTFDDRLVGLMKEYEQTVIEGLRGYNNSESEFWILKVKTTLGDCYRADQGNHGLLFYCPYPFEFQTSSQSFSYSGGRSISSPNAVNPEIKGPCNTVANTLRNNLLEFQAQVNQPSSMGLSDSLWSRI